MIIFGESFTNCSRVPQEQTWPHFLNKRIEDTQFLNFGVDGYSMCQSYLRYQKVRQGIDYDTAMLVFVPTEDLWRDVNVLRKFMDWENYPLVPRFYLDDDQLKLTKSPYKSYAELRHENNRKFSKRLRRYLARYDKFYPKRLLDNSSFLNGLYSFRLFNVALFKQRRKVILESLMRTGSEAMLVTEGIFKKFDRTAEKHGKQFVLVFLPVKTSIVKYQQDPEFRKKYRKMVAFAAANGGDYIDLMKDFVKIDPDKIDLAFDNGHYGPNTNKIISKLLAEHLEDLSKETKSGPQAERQENAATLPDPLRRQG